MEKTKPTRLAWQTIYTEQAVHEFAYLERMPNCTLSWFEWTGERYAMCSRQWINKVNRRSNRMWTGKGKQKERTTQIHINSVHTNENLHRQCDAKCGKWMNILWKIYRPFERRREKATSFGLSGVLCILYEVTSVLVTSFVFLARSVLSSYVNCIFAVHFFRVWIEYNAVNNRRCCWQFNNKNFVFGGTNEREKIHTALH